MIPINQKTAYVRELGRSGGSCLEFKKQTNKKGTLYAVKEAAGRNVMNCVLKNSAQQF